MRPKLYQLAEYSAFALSFLLLKREANAQIIYTDIDPDTIFDEAEEIGYFDIDANGTYDFLFINSSFTFYDTFFSSTVLRQDLLVGVNYEENAIAGNSIYYSTFYGGEFVKSFPYALSIGASIGGKLDWHNANLQRMALRDLFEDGNLGNCFYCNWYNYDLPEIIDHYIGIRFIDIGGENHYGWMRCDVKEEGRVLVVKDYAYELQPDTPINAGDTFSYINAEEFDNSLVNVYSFNSNVYIYFYYKLLDKVRVSIYDLAGKCMFTQLLSEQYTQIQPIVSSGVYLIKLEMNNEVFCKKLYIN